MTRSKYATPRDRDVEPNLFCFFQNCAMISKQAGGIGLAVHNIRATGSYIRGTNGTSNGLVCTSCAYCFAQCCAYDQVPMLRVFNNTARYVDQGGGKRKGAFAVYLEPWHADIFSFLVRFHRSSALVILCGITQMVSFADRI